MEIVDYRKKYNTFKLHSRLGCLNPPAFAARKAHHPRLRSADGLSAPEMDNTASTHYNLNQFPKD